MSSEPRIVQCPLDTEILKKRFLRAGQSLYEIAKEAGYEIVPTHDLDLPIFLSLPIDEQILAVESIENSQSIYEGVLEDGKSVRNPSSVVWKALHKFGLIPPSDFFTHVESDDVVQIYSADGVNKFVNLRFFELSSYTLEQIYCLHWTKLWHRDQPTMDELIHLVSIVLGQDQRTMLAVNGSPHLIEEIASPFKYKINFSMKSMAPAWTKHSAKPAGFLVIQQGELLSAIHSPAVEESLLKEYYFNISSSPLGLVTEDMAEDLEG